MKRRSIVLVGSGIAILGLLVVVVLVVLGHGASSCSATTHSASGPTWSATLPGTPGTAGDVAVSSDEVFVPLSGPCAGVIALDRTSGRQRWYLKVPELFGIEAYTGHLLASQPRSASAADGYNVLDVDASTGRLLGHRNDIQTPILEQPDTPFATAHGDTVFYEAQDGKVHALSFQSGELWAQDLGKNPWAIPTALSQPLLVSTQVDDQANVRELHGVDRRTGAVLWTKQVRSGLLDSSPMGDAVVEGSLAYMLTVDSAAEAVDLRTGNVQWTLPGTFVDLQVDDVPGGAAESVATAGTKDGQVTALDPVTGQQLWTQPVSGRPAFSDSGAISIRYGLFHKDDETPRNASGVPNAKETLIALDPTSGQRLWNAPLGPTGGDNGTHRLFFQTASTVLTNVSESSPRLIALDAATGQHLWTRPQRVDAGIAPVVNVGERFILPSPAGVEVVEAHTGKTVAGYASQGTPFLIQPLSADTALVGFSGGNAETVGVIALTGSG